MHRHRMSHALRLVPNNLRPIPIHNLRIPTLRRIRHVLRKTHPMQPTPLLQLLAQIRQLNQRISSTVPRRHTRVGAVVARIHGLDSRNPLRLRLDDLAVCARWVRGSGARARTSCETAGCDAGVACPRGEDVWVRGEDYVGHHAAGAAACGEDFLRVGLVLCDSVVDHVDEALVVAAAVVGEAFRGVDFPAVAVFLC
jgi:hypothetical protein